MSVVVESNKLPLCIAPFEQGRRLTATDPKDTRQPTESAAAFP